MSHSVPTTPRNDNDSQAMVPLKYPRILLKMSGEALMGTQDYGIDMPTVQRFAREIGEAVALGAEIALVVGAGNIFRGMQGAAQGMDRANGDYMGMLATVMNALALQNALEQANIAARVVSAIHMPAVCEPYARPRALRHLRKKRVLIFAGGTGNPYFTTDTAAVLRALEVNCDCIAKATQVDGVYSADPKQHPDAERYEELSYTDVLARNLKVMDGSAIALARDNELPVMVFSLWEPGNLARAVQGQARSTLVHGQ